MTKIYVGNLPWRATDAQLQELFGAHGEVTDARIVTDRETGRSRGFGFVSMSSPEGAQKAITALNGYSVEGRSLVVTTFAFLGVNMFLSGLHSYGTL